MHKSCVLRARKRKELKKEMKGNPVISTDIARKWGVMFRPCPKMLNKSLRIHSEIWEEAMLASTTFYRARWVSAGFSITHLGWDILSKGLGVENLPDRCT
jgi:hypothetical protein